MEQMTVPIRVLAALGIRDLLLTNAAGGVNQDFRPGDFMVLTDHVNLMGVNPLRGGAIPGQPRFVDMTHVYDVKLSAFLSRAGKVTGLKLRRGVYLAVSGPSYETPAEIRALAQLGADAVGIEHCARGNGGTAMRIERGGGFLHHQSGGGQGQRPIVARGSIGNGGTGKGFGWGITAKFHEVVWRNRQGVRANASHRKLSTH